jgi:hypothetical protein
MVETSDVTEQELLERHINELFDMICYGYEENLTATAERGSCCAIICLYQHDAKHRGIIPIHDHLVPPESLGQKLKEYDILSLMDRLKAKFDPFTLCVKQIKEVIPNVSEERSNIYCVTAEWDTTLDQ